MENQKTLIGRRIRHLRNAQKMTQEELGQKAGLSYKYIGAIERGEKNAPIETLEKIAVALNIEFHEFVVSEHETDDHDELIHRINEILKKANKKEVGTVYRVVKAIMK